MTKPRVVSLSSGLFHVNEPLGYDMGVKAKGIGMSTPQLNASPFDSFKEGSKAAIRGVMSWAAPEGWTRVGASGQTKGDPIFAQKSMDQLRRAAYASDVSTMFSDAQEYPILAVDTTIKEAIAKLATNMFPTGTKFSFNKKENNFVLLDMLKQTRFQLKTEDIVKESAQMGYCGLRSIWLTEAQRWLLEIIPKERLIIETVDGVPEEIIAISVLWSTVRGNVTYWKKERWTPEIYQQWAEIAQKTDGKIPEFKDEDAKTELNIYGEIPVTLIPHFYQADVFGVGVIGPEEFENAKALISLRNKRYYAHLKWMQPNVIRKNQSNPQPLNIGIGSLIDINNENPNIEVDLSLLESQGIPETAVEEMQDHVCAIFRAAGLKPPQSGGKSDSTGMDLPRSGVAMRLIDKDDSKTITTLRDNGYSNVPKHFEKIFRMGSRIGVDGYDIFNPEDPETWQVNTSYPDFFPPTDDDISTQIANMKAASLPVDFMAKRIAALFGIEDDDSINEIAAQLQTERDIENNAQNNTFGGSGG